MEDGKVRENWSIKNTPFCSRQYVITLIYVLVCEQYIRECCTGSCTGTELVRYRWLNLTNLSCRVYVAFFTVAYIYFFLTIFFPFLVLLCPGLRDHPLGCFALTQNWSPNPLHFACNPAALPIFSPHRSARQQSQFQKWSLFSLPKCSDVVDPIALTSTQAWAFVLLGEGYLFICLFILMSQAQNKIIKIPQFSRISSS